MNTEELNVWIAEKLGWSCSYRNGDMWSVQHNGVEVYSSHEPASLLDALMRHAPNFTSDLNDAHEMEKSLEPLIQREKYPEILAQVVAEHEGFRSNGLPLPSFHLVTATAHQRCLAFYRTMGGKE